MLAERCRAWKLIRTARNEYFQINGIRFDYCRNRGNNFDHWPWHVRPFSHTGTYMKSLKGDFADAFNPSAEAFRENELPRFAIYLRSVVTYFVYPINLSLREIRSESFKFEIQRALNSMEMHLIDKPHSFSLFLLFSPLSLSFFCSRCLFRNRTNSEYHSYLHVCCGDTRVFLYHFFAI